jgi:hypothetical protein
MTTASLKRTTKRFLTLLSAVALAGVPSYAQNGGDTIRGTVASIDGKYDISVRDDRGYIDNVSLHDGTVINPTGLTLAPGEVVTIEGRPAGATFVADEIDTPYTNVYAYPYPAYPVAPYPADRFGLRVGGRGFGVGVRG